MYHILFVDSEERHLKKVKKVLEAAPEEYRFYYASAPEIAVSVLEKEKIDVFICELELPVMGGEELLYLGSRVSPETVQIALSPAKDIRSTMEVINRVGIFKLILKPCLLADDILFPVREAVRMKTAMTNEQTEKGIKRKELEGNYYRILDEIEEQKAEYGLILDMLSGLVKKNLDIGMDSDPEKCSGMLHEYALKLQNTFAQHFLFEPESWEENEQKWKLKFHVPEKRRILEIENQAKDKIPPQLSPYLHYAVQILLELVSAHLLTYRVNVFVVEKEDKILLEFRCSLDAAKDEHGKMRYRIKNREEFEKIYRGTIHVLRMIGHKVLIRSKENPYSISVIYQVKKQTKDE